MGEPFFDCQIGFIGCRAMCLKGIMGVKDFEENVNRSETVSPFLFFWSAYWSVQSLKVARWYASLTQEIYCFPLEEIIELGCLESW